VPCGHPRLCELFRIHAVVWSLCLQALTQVCAEVAWSLLNRARFAVVDRSYLFERKGPLDFAEIEKSSVEQPPLIPWPMTAEIPLSQTQTDLLVTCIEEYFLP
jgi:hypothetical protein